MYLIRVAGFLFSQIAAVELLQKTKSTHAHAYFQVPALTSLALGLICVFKSRDIYTAKLTSLHSWYGMMAASLYSINFCIGITKAILKILSLDDNFLFRTLKLIHPVLGVLSIAATGVATSTGIVSYLGVDICSVPAVGWNPLNGYKTIPEVCKIANGLGVVVITAVFLTISGVLLKGYMHLESTNSNIDAPSRVVTGKSARQRRDSGGSVSDVSQNE